MWDARLLTWMYDDVCLYVRQSSLVGMRVAVVKLIVSGRGRVILARLVTGRVITRGIVTEVVVIFRRPTFIVYFTSMSGMVQARVTASAGRIEWG